MKKEGWERPLNTPIAQKEPACPFVLKGLAAAVCVQFAIAPASWAVEFDSGNPDFTARWDNTVKYSGAWRLRGQSGALLADANMDDGDRNFNKGLASNRFSLLSEIDVAYQKKMGFRVSGAAWYDTVYNKPNDNTSPATASQLSVPNNEFPHATRSLHGRDAELLDAFVYSQFELGSMPANVRLGRHTVLYGETLFFGGNGIAGGQAPVDFIKLLTVPGTQFKELLMPVNQASGQVQINSNVTVGGYYQFEWRPTRIPAAGSYLSDADFVGDGAERLFAPGSFGAVHFNRAADIKAKNSGQGGVQIRFRPDSEVAEFGLYATRYHAKDFNLYLNPSVLPPSSASIGTYQQVYGEGIKAFGASVSTTILGANVAAEISTRRNAPLVSDPQVGALTLGVGGASAPGTAVFNNSNNPAYAVGNTAHINISAIYLLNGMPWCDGGSVLAEVAWSRRLSVTRNPGALDPNSTRDAWGLRILAMPTYFQVANGVDLTVPIGLGYNPSGKSSTDVKFNGGVRHGGDFSIGTIFQYQHRVTLGLNYVRFFGPEGTFLTPNQPPPSTQLQYKQSLKDRDFVSLTLQTTF